MLAKRTLIACSLAATFALAGCGSGSDVAEKIAEKAAEEGSGGNVDIEDGNVKFTDEEGNETEFDVSGSAELPEGFPEDLAPPDAVKIITSNTSTVNGQKTMVVYGEAEATVEELAEGLKTQLTDAGYEISNDSSMAGTGGDFVGLTATKGATTVTASVSNAATGDKTAISLSVTEE